MSLARMRYVMMMIGVLALLAPAVSLANGGAGKSQYSDPLGSISKTSSTTTSTPPPSSSTTPGATDTTSSAPAATSSTPAASGTDSSTGTATTPSGTTSSATKSGKKSKLPYTGYQLWDVVGFGVVLIGGGLVMRLRSRGA